MYTIKTFNKISDIGLDILNKKGYKYDEDLNNADAVLLRSFKMNGMEVPKNITAIARCGAGVNNIDVVEMSKQGTIVFNTPGANAHGVKELVLMSLLISTRDILGGIAWVNTLEGQDNIGPLVEKQKSNYGGFEVKGKTIAVLGLGAIGTLVANAALHLNMNVIGYDPFLKVEQALNLSRKIEVTADLDYLYANADFISIHIPLTPKTKDFINIDTLSKLKDNVTIINFARGGLVSDEVVLEGTKSGKINKYITDFPSSKLVNKPNVIQIPHLGASTEESEVNCAVMAADEVIDLLENGNITNSVNYPDCSLGSLNSGSRLTVCHKNIPSMIGTITSYLAKTDVNIENMINRSNGDFSYMMIDFNQICPTSIYNEIEKITGVLKARLLQK